MNSLPLELLSLVLGPAATKGQSMSPFSVDRAARAALTPEVLAAVLLGGNDPAVMFDTLLYSRAIVATARGAEANNAIFSGAFDLVRAGVVYAVSRDTLSALARHGCLAGLKRIYAEEEIDADDFFAVLAASVADGHLTCVHWAMEMLDAFNHGARLNDEGVAEPGYDWVSDWTRDLSDAAFEAFSDGHVDALDAVFERLTADAGWVGDMDLTGTVNDAISTIRYRIDRGVYAVTQASGRWLLRNHDRFSASCSVSIVMQVARIALRCRVAVPLPEIIEYVCAGKSRCQLLPMVAAFAFQHCALEVAEAIVDDDRLDIAELVRVNCRKLHQAEMRPYDSARCDTTSTTRMVTAALRRMEAPHATVAILLDAMHYCGRLFEPQVLDALDAIDEDIKVLAVAIASGCDAVAERALSGSTLMTPENRLVALAAALYAGPVATKQYYSRLVPPGFLDGDVGAERLCIASGIAATAIPKEAGGFRAACRQFRVENALNPPGLGEAVWPSSAAHRQLLEAGDDRAHDTD
jgi:hypothetical protein